MKTGVYIMMFALLLTGCNDFLKETSQDEVRPSTVSDLEQILVGEAYLSDYNIYNITDIFTDNMECYGVQNEKMQGIFDGLKWRYTWDDDMFAKAGGGNLPIFWEVPYKGIGGCNVVLDHLDKMYGKTDLRENLRGEALVLRAWYYFQLVNLYGFPYNYGDPKQNLGVPLKLNSSVKDEKFTRNTVAEVYEQIEKDLLKGCKLLKDYEVEKEYFRIGYIATQAILSRVYLYMENWDKALAYADSVLQVKSALLDLNQFGIRDPYDNVFESVYSPVSSDEIIWARMYSGTSVGSILGSQYKYPFALSQEFIEVLGASYDACLDETLKDLRGVLFVSWGYDSKNYETPCYPHAAVKDRDFGMYQGIRTAELYLNRAEACARKFQKEGIDSYRVQALTDLNELRRHRMNNAFEYETVEITDAQLLLDFCLLERRKELSGETNHRWFDLKRFGMTELTHSFFGDPTETKSEYKLEKEGYLLPIPEEAIRLNTDLEQNKRKVSK